MYTNPRYVNELGGILLEQDDGVDLYIDSGELYARAAAGEFGAVVVAYTEKTPEEAAYEARAMMRVSRLQAKIALYNAGLLDAVQTHMDTQADAVSVMAWNEAQEFQRLSPTILAVAVALNWTDIDLDNLFIQAAEIVV